MSEAKTLDKKRVAAVCGNEVIIYGGQRPDGIRPRLDSYEFPHHGAALAYAVEFDRVEEEAARKARR